MNVDVHKAQGGHARRAFAERRFHTAWTPSRFDLTRARRMREELAGRPQGRLLDVGCYDGQLITAVVAPHQQGPLVGADCTHAALCRARERGVLPVRADLEAPLPFVDAAFAAVVAAEIVEHIFDTQAFLDELARVLQPGGALLLTTPNLVALSGRAKLLLGKSPQNVEFDASPSTSGHIRHFTFDTLEVLVRRAGLSPVHRSTNVAHFSVRCRFIRMWPSRSPSSGIQPSHSLNQPPFTWRPRLGQRVRIASRRPVRFGVGIEASSTAPPVR